MILPRADLLALLETSVAALGANDPARLPLAPRARFAENCVEMPFGDGAWGTVTGIGDYRWSLADPVTGNAARFGTFDESGVRALFVLRIAANAKGEVTEFELVVGRPVDSGVPFLATDIGERPELVAEVPPASRASRERLRELADGYFATLQQNDGTIRTRFHPDCNRREVGVNTTNNPQPDLAPIARLGCEEQFRLGYYRFDDWIRARRYPLLDEEAGVALAGGFIDHDGRLREYTLTDGNSATGFFLRPHSFAFLEAFKIRDDAIAAVEAVFHFVPYRMRSPWAEDGPDPREG
ncbi:MAG TPA: hypothetical protein VF418_04390 [Sphingomonadaceae bacterium]